MRTFVSALLVATAVAQNSTSNSTTTTSTSTSATDSIKKAVSDVTNWLLGKTKENLSTDSQKQEVPLYDVTNTTMGLAACFSLDNTALGVNFVTARLDVSGYADKWANGTAVLAYFQVEQPVPTPAARLLQASNSTSNTTVATGTGNYEGWSGSAMFPLTNNTVVLKTNKNSWGKKLFKGDNQVYTSFGGADAVNTNSSSAW